LNASLTSESIESFSANIPIFNTPQCHVDLRARSNMMIPMATLLLLIAAAAAQKENGKTS
jgi:hypothetical protein